MPGDDSRIGQRPPFQRENSRFTISVRFWNSSLAIARISAPLMPDGIGRADQRADAGAGDQRLAGCRARPALPGSRIWAKPRAPPPPSAMAKRGSEPPANAEAGPACCRAMRCSCLRRCHRPRSRRKSRSRSPSHPDASSGRKCPDAIAPPFDVGRTIPPRSRAGRWFALGMPFAPQNTATGQAMRRARGAVGLVGGQIVGRRRRGNPRRWHGCARARRKTRGNARAPRARTAVRSPLPPQRASL